MICAAEQSVVCMEEVYDDFKARLAHRGCHFLYGDERHKLGNYLFRMAG